MFENFSQWRAENSMSAAFMLAELNRQFGLLHETDNAIVAFTGGVGPVADEIRGKSFVLDTWDELYDGEIFDTAWPEEDEDEYLPNDPDGLTEQANELRDKNEEEVE